MSIYAIKQYHRELEDLKHYGGTTKETAIRFAFQKLLDEYGKPFNLRLVPEVSLKLKTGRIVTPDGTLKDQLRLDHGYWESKDESDDINEEINKKFSKGYPSDNILFEDSQTAVLFQHGAEVMRTPMEDEAEFDRLLVKYVQFERQEVKDFREAIEKFKEDIPKVTAAIHEIISHQQTNEVYQKARQEFHELCKQSINPDITESDITEMMVQHILSADIFNTIFDEPHFHQENNIARELNKVVETFFTGATRRQTLGRIKHYYDTINANAAGIADHHEKQKFLKVVYENFYKAYNPKAADRLGIVYTPNEIVHFMIKSTDYLLHKHFGKTLADKNVEILDPATGTGTFICDIIDFLPRNKLAYKYKNELHANEVAILPYYIANLNIEYTYKQKMGEYAEFESLCFVDTLDNTGFHWVGKQGNLFGVSAENAERIRKQNEKKISVIIGNPPYNAKQENYNYQNANKAYKDIDKRIKETYIKNGTAQNQIVVYDMYTRFFRWAGDRIQDDGIVCMISNNSYINARAFDGFRKSLKDEYQYIYIVDLGGNIRELSGKDGIFLNEKHTIFGEAAAVGISIAFLIKDKRKKLLPCQINYIHPCDIRATRDEKLAYLNEHRFEEILFEHIIPDKKNNWINQSENDWDDLLPLIDKEAKSGKRSDVIFQSFSYGFDTKADEFMFDFSGSNLEAKIKHFVTIFNLVSNENNHERKFEIKWSRNVEKRARKGLIKLFDEQKITSSLYRPFIKKFLYFDKDLIAETFQWFNINDVNQPNYFLCFSGLAASKPFQTLISTFVSCGDFLEKTQCLPLYRYTKEGQRIDNITDWALQQFRDHYTSMRGGTTKQSAASTISNGEIASLPRNDEITKENIFHYVYAVLHHPAYRKKYELNLKREFPRIPFYDNFPQWCTWGEQLMQLHIGYETVVPYDLMRTDTDYELKNVALFEKFKKAKLKANKDIGEIELDGFTKLSGIPKIAWEYKLGNRSALEWVLDQYKEKKPSDPTIAEKFNTYRFADYKEQVVDLLQRVCTVSVETMKIVHTMPAE